MDWSTLYPAPAKLNLFLHVVGRRSDGYHLLETAFRLIDYGDNLSFAPLHTKDVTRTNPILSLSIEEDLCVRAARLLQQETGCNKGVAITLNKKLPMGGGLGGGSSDAATTLLALNHLWNLKLSRTELQKIGLKLGADVPFFIYGQSAFGEGVGEQFQPIDLAPAWYLVLTPPVSVSTREIFAAPELTRDTKKLTIAGFSRGVSGYPVFPGGFGRNDLEPVVFAKYPIVAEHLAYLKSYGFSRMTGSGACVFAEFATEDEAHQVLKNLPQPMQGWIARGLDNHPLKDLAK